jgi:hypothetical protein
MATGIHPYGKNKFQAKCEVEGWESDPTPSRAQAQEWLKIHQKVHNRARIGGQSSHWLWRY